MCSLVAASSSSWFLARAALCAALGEQRVLKRRPGQRERLLVIGTERLVHDRPVVGDRDVEGVGLGPSLDIDLLVDDLGLAATRP